METKTDVTIEEKTTVRTRLMSGLVLGLAVSLLSGYITSMGMFFASSSQTNASVSSVFPRVHIVQPSYTFQLNGNDATIPVEINVATVSLIRAVEVWAYREDFSSGTLLKKWTTPINGNTEATLTDQIPRVTSDYALVDGRYYLLVLARTQDTTGDVFHGDALSFSIDATPPPLQIGRLVDGIPQSIDARIVCALPTVRMYTTPAEEMWNVKLSLDSNLVYEKPPLPPTTYADYSFPSLTTGSHTLRLQAQDTNGNSGTAQATFTFNPKDPSCRVKPAPKERSVAQ